MTLPAVDPPPTSLCDDLDAALREVLARHEQSVLTRWVIAIESCGDDGERGLWLLPSNGTTSWDVMGMLRYALVVSDLDIQRQEANPE